MFVSVCLYLRDVSLRGCLCVCVSVYTTERAFQSSILTYLVLFVPTGNVLYLILFCLAMTVNVMIQFMFYVI